MPRLVGMRLARAKGSLADRGLTAKVTYKSTDSYPAGTVISQSRKAGADVLPDTTISLVVANAPPPPPPTAPPAPPPTAPSRDCHPSYPDVCLRPDASDYDCEGSEGNGPYYVSGPLRVLPPDPFELDGNDNNGWGMRVGMTGNPSTSTPTTVGRLGELLRRRFAPLGLVWQAPGS